MPARRAILITYFVLGAYAIVAQATLLREAQVILLGSELSWGLVLAFWLLGFGVGAKLGSLGPKHSQALLRLLAAPILGIPAILALTIMFLRVSRSLIGAGTGEYVSPSHMVWISLVATMPISLLIGMTLPSASVLVASGAGTNHAKAQAIGWVYLVESAGSLVGGALYSFVLVGRVGAIPLALAGGAVLAAATVPLVTALARRRAWGFAPAAVAGFLALLTATGLAGTVEAVSQHLRWGSFASGQKLVASADSRYENIAVGRLENQYSLYLNGMVAATWPNHTEAATEAHLAACECPDPRRILLLGGGLEGLVKELRRYKPERLDYVTLDPMAVEAITPLLDAPDREAARKLRQAGGVHYADIRRFVKEEIQWTEPRYDLVILAAPEPTSTLDSRLYTLEFFQEVSELMAERGVLALALHGSAGFWSAEPAEYVGSIVLPLRTVFPEVLLTFGYPTRVFVARKPGVLVDTGEALAARYKKRGVASPYFDPLWFEGATDMLDPAKRRDLAKSLAAHPPELLNTDARPVAGLYYMRMRLQTVETAHAGAEAPATERASLPGAILRLRGSHFTWAIVVATVAAGAVSFRRGRRGLQRTALAWSVGTTGFASMAIEMVLLYTFQTAYGYVYGMIGLVVGLFMFGLVLGSLFMNWHLRSLAETGRAAPHLRSMILLDVALALFALALGPALDSVRTWTADWALQGATYLLVAASGMLGGLVFPLAAAVHLGDEPNTARTAGAIAVADYAGACLGALLTGLVLVPVLGVSGACAAILTTKLLSASLVGMGSLIRPIGADVSVS